MELTDKLLLRPAEVAELLSISRSKVYELISSGRIPSIRLESESLLRVPLESLRELIRKAEQDSKTSQPL
jgi:excisionase family DNA binding protein